MPSVFLPDHRLIRHPTVLRITAPPALAHGGFICPEGDLKTVVFYRQFAPGRAAQEIGAYAMTEEDFSRSLLIAAIDFLPGILSARQLVH